MTDNVLPFKPRHPHPIDPTDMRYKTAIRTKLVEMFPILFNTAMLEVVKHHHVIDSIKGDTYIITLKSFNILKEDEISRLAAVTVPYIDWCMTSRPIMYKDPDLQHPIYLKSFSVMPIDYVINGFEFTLTYRYQYAAFQ